MILAKGIRETSNEPRQLRVLFIIGQYSKLGGAERQALILADQLRNEHHCHIEFLAWGGMGRVTDELEKRSIKTWTFPLRWNTPTPRRIATLWRLGRFIRREIQPDILLPYIGFNCKIIGLIWRATGARYTWWNQRDEGRAIYGSWLERFVIQRVPDVVSNSCVGRDFLVQKFGLSAESIRIINNGVVIPGAVNRKLWRDRLGLAEQDILVTMVANLTRYKDHETLLRAFASLGPAAGERRLHLLLVGRLDETTHYVKALAFDLGLCGRTYFPGAIDEVGDCYAASDLVVHSSGNEGCPNAVLEAMAHGLAVCGTDIPGMRQALGEEGAADLLSERGDAVALAQIMRRLAGDVGLRESLGRRNRQRIEKQFSPAALAENVLELIRSHGCREAV